MRVADSSMTRNYLKYLTGAKSDFATTMEQISTGNRFTELSDDVSAGSKVMNIRMDMYNTETQLGNIGSISDELTIAEDAMSQTSELLTRVHALGVKAGTETQGTAGWDAILKEVEAITKELLAYANSTFGEKFVFGATNSSDDPPFDLGDDGNLIYNGVPINDIQKRADGTFFHSVETTPGVFEEVDIPMDGDVYLDIGLGIKMTGSNVDPDTAFLVSHSGIDIFGYGTDADTGYANNIFNALNEFQGALESGDIDEIGALNDHITDLANTFRAHLSDMGARVNFLEGIEGKLETNLDTYKIRINDLMGINDAEAVETLAQQEFVLQAVQQMGSRILPNSLMDYLR